MVEVTEKGLMIMEFLRANDGADITSQDIAEHLGISARSVTGAVTALAKENVGLVFRDEVESTELTKTGKERKVVTKYIRLTDAGRTADLAIKTAKSTKKKEAAEDVE